MRLYVDRNKRIEFIVAVICFILSIAFVIIGAIILPVLRSQEVLSTVEGKYCSYRIERHVSGKSTYSRSIYLKLELQDGNIEEYKIFENLIFDEKDFFDDISVGDYVKLTVEGQDSIRSIEANGHSYMTLEDSTEVGYNWNAIFFWMGLVFATVSGLAAIAQVEKKHGHRRRRSRRKR